MDIFPQSLVYEAVSTEQLLDELSSRKFDISILDGQIPDDEGFETIKKVRNIQQLPEF